MKKIFILLALLIPVFAIGQTTSWADTLAKFEKVESKKNFNWFADSLNDTRKLKRVMEWYNLKVNVEIENRNNFLADSSNQILTRNQQKQAYIAHLQTHGYLGDNSLSDWYKLYNHPEIFGSNWQGQADYGHSVSTGIWDFINKWLQYRQALNE